MKCPELSPEQRWEVGPPRGPVRQPACGLRAGLGGDRSWDPHAGHQQPSLAGRQNLEGRPLAGEAGKLMATCGAPGPGSWPGLCTCLCLHKSLPKQARSRSFDDCARAPHRPPRPWRTNAPLSAAPPPASLLMGKPREGQPPPEARVGPTRHGLGTPPPPPQGATILHWGPSKQRAPASPPF